VVLSGSKIWGPSRREEHAAAYGIEPDELEEHYRRRNLAKVDGGVRYSYLAKESWEGS
jgi:hypothetical protein